MSNEDGDEIVIDLTNDDHDDDNDDDNDDNDNDNNTGKRRRSICINAMLPDSVKYLSCLETLM